MRKDEKSPRPDVTLGVDKTGTAHHLMPLGLSEDMARFGIAECGYPAEHLTLLHELNWSQVTPDRRCANCDASDRADRTDEVAPTAVTGGS